MHKQFVVDVVVTMAIHPAFYRLGLLYTTHIGELTQIEHNIQGSYNKETQACLATLIPIYIHTF